MESLRTWFCVYLCLISNVFLGQGSYVTKQYTLNSGLFSHDVRTLFVDSKDVLWIGSRSGLSKLSQGRFKNSETALEHNFSNVTSIVEYNLSTLLFGSYGNGLLYIGEKESRVFTEADGLVSERVRSLFIHKHYVYIGTAAGVSVLNLNTFKITNPIFQFLSEDPYEISGFFEHKGVVYLTTINQGTYRIDKNKLTKVNSIKRILSVYNRDNLIFYGCQDGLRIEDLYTEQIKCYPDTPNVNQILEVKGELLFACAGLFENKGGLFKWNGSEVIPISDKYKIPALDLMTIAYNEKYDFLYVGSKSEGLYKVSYAKELSYDNTIQNVMALATLDDKIAVFYDKGLVLQRGPIKEKFISSSVFKQYQEKNYSKFLHISTKANHFFEIDYTISADKIIFYKALENNGFLWVSSNIGMFKLDKNGTIIGYYNIHTYQFDFLNGKLIVSNPYGGVKEFKNPDIFDFTYYTERENKNVPRNIVDIVSIHNRLYFGGALDGLYSYSKNGGFLSLNTYGIFKEKRIKFMVALGETIYLSNDINSVYKFDLSKKNPHLEQVISGGELLGANINLLEVVNNKLVIGTNKGFTVLTNDGKYFYDEEQGLFDTEILSSTQIGNILYIGCKGGLYALDTDYFHKRNIFLKAQLSNIFVKGKPYNVDGKSIGTMKSLELPYNSNSIQIYFDVLGAKYSNKLFFKYRLKPTDSWKAIEEQSIALLFLESGKYQIELKIDDRGWGNEYIVPILNLVIDKPFYLQTWFFVTIGSLLIGATVLIYKYRIKQLKIKQIEAARKLTYEKRLAEVKLLAVRSQMNSHFIFNVMSSIQYFIIHDEQDKAFDYLGDFAKLIRLSLTNSMKERITILEEIDYLKKYVSIENIRFEDRIRFVVNIENGIDVNMIYVPPMLLQPFVENSLVHAFPKTIQNPVIEIDVKSKDNNLILIVRDNGIGSTSVTERRHDSTSIGMNLVREKMTLIQEYLEEDILVSITEKGTEVIIKLRGLIKKK